MRYLSSISLALVALMALACTATATPLPTPTAAPTPEPPALNPDTVKDMMRSYLSDQLETEPECLQSLIDGMDDRDCLYQLLDNIKNRNCLDTLIHGDAEVRKQLERKIIDYGGRPRSYQPLTYERNMHRPYGSGYVVTDLWIHSWAGREDEYCRLSVNDKESRVMPDEGYWKWISD
jgi:hypothetical protein